MYNETDIKKNTTWNGSFQNAFQKASLFIHQGEFYVDFVESRKFTLFFSKQLFRTQTQVFQIAKQPETFCLKSQQLQSFSYKFESVARCHRPLADALNSLF